jgi:hypothetical protein
MTVRIVFFMMEFTCLGRAWIFEPSPHLARLVQRIGAEAVTMKLIGVLLIVVGVLALALWRVQLHHPRKGGRPGTAEGRRRQGTQLPIAPIAGVAALVGGIALVGGVEVARLTVENSRARKTAEKRLFAFKRSPRFLFRA